MLQCTTVTALPRDEAFAALGRMGDADDAADMLDEKPYVSCELGEHGDEAEHAAHLWTAETDPPAGLWFLWTESEGGYRVHHQFVTRALCPVRIHYVKEDRREWCAYYDGHPGNHSFHVRDPLREAHHAQIRRDADDRDEH